MNENGLQNCFMENPLVSVIIPIYNGSQWLNECIQSVLNQSYQNIEVICINDGSTDSSRDIIAYYLDVDRRVALIEQENSGSSSARNKGINYAKGEWLLFLDADDCLSDHAIEELLYCTRENKADYVIGRYSKKQDELGNGTGKCTELSANKLRTVLLDWKQYNRQLPSSAQFPTECSLAYIWGRLIRRNILGTTIRFNKQIVLGEDVLFNYDILSINPKVCLLDKTIYYYRQNSRSVTSNFHARRKANTEILSKELYKRVSSSGDRELMQAARQFIFGRVVHCYMAYFSQIDPIKRKQEQKELLSVPCINESVCCGRVKNLIIPQSKRLKLSILLLQISTAFNRSK